MLANYLSDIFGKLGIIIRSCISWVKRLMTLSLNSMFKSGKRVKLLRIQGPRLLVRQISLLFEHHSG